MFAEIASPDIILIVALVVVLMFGGSKLPELARGLGRAKKEFEEASSQEADAATSDDG
jgi:sec-independent protein translocase protein TatA